MMRRPQREKPPLTLVALGASGHGKTSLVQALSRRSPAQGGIASGPAQGKRRAAFSAPEYSYESASRRYHHRDGAGHEGVLRGLVFGPTPPGAAILVVSGAAGVAHEVAEQLALARELGVTS